MTARRFTPTLLAALACGLLAAGCGDDEDKGDSGAPAATTPAATSPAPGIDAEARKDAEEAAKKAAGGDVQGALDGARAACREQAGKLTGDAKAQALKVCSSSTAKGAVESAGLTKGAKAKADEAVALAEKGDTEGALAKAREACQEQAKARLDGQAETTALELCKSAGATSGATP